MKVSNKEKHILFIFLICALIFSCEKTKRYKVDILPTFEVTPTTIMAGGYIVEYGKNNLVSTGICFDLVPNSQLEGTYVISSDSLSNRLFTCQLTDLISDTIYYLRAFVEDVSGKFVYSEEITIRTIYTIGSPGPAGGTVFYVNEAGGGLEVAPTDQGTNVYWGCTGTSIAGANNTEIGYGAINTLTIITNCSESNCAAKICDEYSLNGYDDWYLPSLDELALIYLNAYSVDKGNLNSGFYWSSTEQNNEKAWSILFGTGSKVDNYKNYSDANVRPVRTF